ncbi:protein TPX2 isoform X2 [Jatropha curcas]|uniref:protein TPX2 isoform X2 n=1 Tax=Jatropha curcas TaxID=180498 RepID=UPI001893418E|nr:protein TPX2 isoform X2 [Jatropha curcas]
MDFDMEEFFIEPFLAGEIDIDYEFDAAKYYDFTRQETDLEAQEAERWFETAGRNLPSRLESYRQAKTSPTKLVPSKHLNFMNPTASQLAKQNSPPQIHGDRLLRRCQKFLKDEMKGSRSSSMNGTQATKRQKLEAGYLWKAACLKHQALFSHKTPKVTIPREPNLETSLRAERHRINLESIENTKSDACNFKARPLNRKIFKAPSVPLPKKSTPQPPEFQVFHLRTSERAIQHTATNAANTPNCTRTQQNETISSRRVNHVAALKEKLEALDKFKARCLDKKECNLPTDKRSSIEPPIEFFSKLSLASEIHSNAQSRSNIRHPEGSKENAPGSLRLEHEIKNLAKAKRPSGNHFQCGSNHTVPSIIPQISSRTLRR